MTRRAASFLILIAMAISGGYAIASPRVLHAGCAQTVVSEKADRAETQSFPAEHPALSAAQPAAPLHQAPSVRSPHLDPRYQRPPPSR
jgi:hypothetical protein